MSIDKELYDSIQEQFPNPYSVDELYPVQYKLFSPVFSYFAAKNRLGYLRIFKVVASKTKIGINVFRFTKKKELKEVSDYILVEGKERDEELYKYFKKLLNNKKNI